MAQAEAPHSRAPRTQPPAACTGCSTEGEQLQEMPGAWCVKRWLCFWCAELATVAHQLGNDLDLPWALPNPGKRVRR